MRQAEAAAVAGHGRGGGLQGLGFLPNGLSQRLLQEGRRGRQAQRCEV